MKNLVTKKCLSSHWLNFYEKVIKQRMERKVDSRSFRDGAVKKPKILSSKKPPAFSGIRREVPSAGLPVQYHASHTWTRQGRLKELRIRCVARKFLYLWIRMTFGRVFPSKARFYYEQRILQKVFDEWKEEWWVSHHEWKLCVRADCHYRYYLYNLMFQTWKTYVRQQQEMRNEYMRAESHDSKQKMRQAWKSWLIYVVVRRTKLQMQTTALEFRQRSILRVWWSEWMQRLGQVRVSRALHASAMKHRALSLQLQLFSGSQAWSRWREQFLHGQREKEKMVSAVRHRQHWQKRRFLKAWLEYLQIRRMKRQQNEMAERFHRVTVLQIHFCDWQWAWEWRESLYAQRARVEELARRMALRRAFVHWKHYMLLRAEEAAQCEMAEEHRRHRLLYVCFRTLKDNVTRAHLHRIRRNLAYQQHDVTLLRRFWNLWQSRIEQREDKEHLPLLRAAWDHYRTTLLCKCIKLWLQYTQKQRNQQLLQARADSHFQQRALPAAFHAWCRLWRWRRQESVLRARATRFHREMLEKQVFAIWWQKMFVHQEDRLAERMAILHAERQLLRRSWSTWCQQAAARHQERERQRVACAHHCHRRLRKAFCIWREGAQGLRTERMCSAQAAEFRSARLLHWAWTRWRECLALRGAERQKLVLAALHRQHRLLHRALQTWVGEVWAQGQPPVLLVPRRRTRAGCGVSYGRWRPGRASTTGSCCGVCCVAGGRTLWPVWMKPGKPPKHVLTTEGPCVPRSWSGGGKLHRCRFITGSRRTAPSGRPGRCWTGAVSGPGFGAGGTAAGGRRGRESGWRGRRGATAGSCCWGPWPDGRRTTWAPAAPGHPAPGTETLRGLLPPVETAAGGPAAGAAGYGARPVVLGLLAAGKGTGLCISLRVRGGPWAEALGEPRQAGPAHSCVPKAWAAWLGFVQERRRKAARLERAVQAYHRQLLAEGAARLLRFSAGMKASRQQLQARQQVQAAHKLHRAVRHCATLWKQKVLGCGREPQPPAPVAASRRVTFEGPLLDQAGAGAGDATRETKRPQAPQPQGALGSLALATGEPHLRELAARSARKQPRRPLFLLEPVQSQWSLGCGTLQRQGPEKLQECGLSTTRPAGPSLMRAALAEAPKAPVPSSLLPGALSGAPCPELPPTARTGPELLLLPPSSFMPRGAEAPARVSALPTTPKPKPQAPPSPARLPDPRLLLPGDFTDTRAGPGSETAGRVELEAELEGIQQQLQHYQATKQNLRSCQRQASSLRRWLELSREEPRPEDREMELQVQQELEEVELQIQQLAEELQAQRQPIGACVTRIQALRRSLC
ncbi:protein SFI1 homolog isoform X2 [Lemur catta]|uniref:protein SFI1 homolog isoform X2 n=1 Tax=Lemur catta TaxID=9447 RepID=UPI001E26BBB5|nr:protein SFI1 homolog isoform X2 [Lemur catta]